MTCVLIQFVIYYALYLAWRIVAPRSSGGSNLEIVVTSQLNSMMRKYLLYPVTIM